MGRFSSTPTQQLGTNQTNTSLENWPTSFEKEVIGIDRNAILEDCQILRPENVSILSGSLEAIKIMRLKGHRVVLFFNEPLISEGRMTPNEVDIINNHLMQLFGQAGIQSIDGIYYSTSSFKEDIFSLPNNGMLKKSENEMKLNFKKGYFVGGKLYDLKAGHSVGAKPILIRTNNYQETEEKLNTFANRNLKLKTKVYNSLLEFALSL